MQQQPYHPRTRSRKPESLKRRRIDRRRDRHHVRQTCVRLLRRLDDVMPKPVTTRIQLPTVKP